MHSFWHTGVRVNKYLSIKSNVFFQWYVLFIQNIDLSPTYTMSPALEWAPTELKNKFSFSELDKTECKSPSNTDRGWEEPFLPPQKTQDMKQLLEVVALYFYRTTDTCWLKVPAIQTLAFLYGIWMCFPSSRSGDSWFLSHISVCSSMSHSPINLHSGRNPNCHNRRKRRLRHALGVSSATEKTVNLSKVPEDLVNFWAWIWFNSTVTPRRWQLPTHDRRHYHFD